MIYHHFENMTDLVYGNPSENVMYLIGYSPLGFENIRDMSVLQIQVKDPSEWEPLQSYIASKRVTIQDARTFAQRAYPNTRYLAKNDLALGGLSQKILPFLQTRRDEVWVEMAALMGVKVESSFYPFDHRRSWGSVSRELFRSAHASMGWVNFNCVAFPVMEDYRVEFIPMILQGVNISSEDIPKRLKVQYQSLVFRWNTDDKDFYTLLRNTSLYCNKPVSSHSGFVTHMGVRLNIPDKVKELFAQR